MNLVEAQVVLPALQQREARRAGQRIGERVDQLGQIAVDQLALQGDRRGRHHDRRVVGHRAGDRRNQVRQRLSGAGSRLHRQVLAGVEGVRDRGGHLAVGRCVRCRPAPPPRWPAAAGTDTGNVVGRGYSCVVDRPASGRDLRGGDRRIAVRQHQTLPRQASQARRHQFARHAQVRRRSTASPCAHQRDRQRPRRLSWSGGGCAGRMHDLFGDRCRSNGTAAAPLCGRRAIPCARCASRRGCRRPRPACRPCSRSALPSR